jgi:hypothetical protein
MGVCFHRATLLGNMEGRSFHRAFEVTRYINKYVQMPCKQLSLSRGAPLWKLEGICLPGLFERKGKYIRMPFLDPEDIQILSLGAMWNLVKGQGCPELVSDYGAQKACL